MAIDDVQDISPRVQYVAAPAQTIFTYPFPITAEADIVVYVNTVLKALGTDYTVEGEGFDTGGTVTFLVGRTAGEIVTLYRDIPIARTTDFAQNGPWKSTDTNAEFNFFALIMQQLEARIGRSLRWPIIDDATDAQLELNPISNWVSKYVFINSNGLPEPAAIVPTSISQSLIGVLLFPQTASEAAAGVTPSNYAWRAFESPRYGALGNGSTDDRAALQKMLDSAAAQPSGLDGCAVAELKNATSSFRADDMVSFDSQKVLLEGHGNTLDFSAKTVGGFTGLRIFGTDENLNRQFLRNSVRGARNLQILMPSYTVNPSGVGLELVDLVDNAGSYRAAAITLENISIMGGAVALRFGNGAWGSTIKNLVIGHDSGNLGAIAVDAPAPWTDGREAPKFIGGHISNRTIGFRVGVGDLIISSMTLDGLPIIAQLSGTGQLIFSNGYSEFTDGDNAQFKYRAEDANARIEISQWTYVVRPDILASRTKALFNGDGGGGAQGRFILKDLVFIGNNSQWYNPTNGGFLIDGTGEHYASGLIYQSFPWAPLLSKNRQWLAYPDCNNANVLAAFTLSNSGAFNPVRVAGVTDGGGTTRDVVRFQINNGAAAASFSRAVFTHAVKPGQRGTFCGQAFGALTGSNVIFQATTTARDAANNTITTSTATIQSASVANYTTFGFDLGIFPAGTETVLVQIQLLATGVVSGNITWNVSPFAIGLADGQ